MEYLKEYDKWCNSDFFDKETKAELLEIKEDENEIKNRFYKELEFGTAGLRGVMGAGTNYMNKYTVGKATQGLANYIIKQGAEKKSVAIGFDSRNMSSEFSKIVALILNANGIKTYKFASLRPVPELSFAVKELGCIAGIMITASHNPPKYNGYKVYWEGGAPIVYPQDVDITKEIKRIDDYEKIKTINKEEAEKSGLYNIISEEIDNKYIENLKKLVLNKESIEKEGKNLKIVYTPLNGAGKDSVKRVLSELGFEKVYIVKEQEMPDGNFPTVKFPNPEEPEALTLALKLAKEKDADLVIATDPDSDRMGAYVKDKKTGEYIRFNGNMTGTLLIEYEFSQKEEKGILPKNGAMVKTIVSSNLPDEMAKKYNVKMFETLTGFKYIGEKIKEFEKNKDYEFLIGYEESFGYLIGTNSKDKDGVVTTMVMCEAAAYYKEKGLTLYDQLINIYEKYGYYKEDSLSIVLEGKEGIEKMKEIMEKLRNKEIKEIGEYKVKNIKDYSIGKSKNIETGELTDIELPKSNVLYYELYNNSWLVVRPSGTEPKIKFYMGVKGNSSEDAEQKAEKLKIEMKKLAEV